LAELALISDLHSNLEAVEAVLHRIDSLGVREIACLGDVVGYGADPLPVTRIVMQRCKWTIQGNHDWGLFHELDDFNPLAREALMYSRAQLQPSFWRFGRQKAWDFLRSLPDRKEDHGFLFFHGSPRDPVMEYVLKSDGFLEPEKMQHLFTLIDRPCFVGHTHWPGVHRPDFRFTQATDEDREFRLDRGPCIVNVGSVGQPRDGDNRASFAVAFGDRVEIHRVPYDFRRAQAKILAAGLHPALAERLARGK
jgi:diadenosine tetraphosphatase ApaH/serine/threonine PP2A family protein phosphatase